MKHKWKLMTPYSSPVLIATTSLRTPMRYSTGWRIHCSKCNEHLDIPYDVLDSERIADFVVKQKQRDDCKGNRK